VEVISPSGKLNDMLHRGPRSVPILLFTFLALLDLLVFFAGGKLILEPAS
jgi:hypothetical protein